MSDYELTSIMADRDRQECKADAVEVSDPQGNVIYPEEARP
jgi:hypothetical protein